MRELTDALLQMVRMLGLMERNQICCGTVTVPQCIVLQALLAGPQKVTDLAGSSGVSPSAMTRLLDGLEQKGWVERTQADGDRRKVMIQLTSSGQSEAERLRELTETSVAQVMSHIPETKHDMVAESISLLRQAVEKAHIQGLSCCASPSTNDL